MNSTSIFRIFESTLFIPFRQSIFYLHTIQRMQITSQCLSVTSYFSFVEANKSFHILSVTGQWLIAGHCQLKRKNQNSEGIQNFRGNFFARTKTTSSEKVASHELLNRGGHNVDGLVNLERKRCQATFFSVLRVWIKRISSYFVQKEEERL